MRRLLCLLLVTLPLAGCYILKMRPLGGPEIVSRKDLPQVRKIDGDPVRSFLRPDAIPSVDDPQFVPASQATFMREEEKVLGLVQDGIAKAYSLWHLDRHEVVNDSIGGQPVAVTW